MMLKAMSNIPRFSTVLLLEMSVDKKAISHLKVICSLSKYDGIWKSFLSPY